MALSGLCATGEQVRMGQRGDVSRTTICLRRVCSEVLSISSAILEDRTRCDSRKKAGQKGTGNHGSAGTISLVAQSGSERETANGLVFPAGASDSAWPAPAGWLPAAAGISPVRAGGVCRCLPADAGWFRTALKQKRPQPSMKTVAVSSIYHSTSQ